MKTATGLLLSLALVLCYGYVWAGAVGAPGEGGDTVAKGPHLPKQFLREACLETLFVLSDSLVRLQISDRQDANFGAIGCPSDGVLHTRAGEAVYPLAVAYKHSGDEKYLEAAVRLGNWLISQQQADGSWLETPETWTGTSTDQLLMMANAFPIVRDHLSELEQEKWKVSMKAAADYLTEVMSPEFASINYCATTTASLAMTNRVIPDKRYADKARLLAKQVVSKMDEAGFITGEGGRVHGVKYGVDLGYGLEMSLWGLKMYANVTGDTEVDDAVRKALKEHVYFIYPDGSLDGSWGIRSNKWTTYGSATADGCQILFALFAGEDGRYLTAAMRNLTYLRSMIHDGLITYGPHHWEVMDHPPCVYPTFVRPKNLALAVEYGAADFKPPAPLPTDAVGWLRFFPTVDVAMARTKNFVTTITAYNYKDIKNGPDSKYMHRPTGGSISNLWVEGHGLLQASSVTEYQRWEPMHFPEAEGIICLTPRIEFVNEDGYFTNLYEFDGRISTDAHDPSRMVISTSGELKDRTRYEGGVAYVWTHTFSDDAVEKAVRLRYHGKQPEVTIVEPIVQHPGMTFTLADPKTVEIRGGRRAFKFELLEGDAQIELGRDAGRYWHPYPALRCYPITLHPQRDPDQLAQEIVYRITLLSN